MKLSIHLQLAILGLACLGFSFMGCGTKDSGSGAGAFTLDRDGVNISGTDCGSGDTTLLFVHGWCLNQSYWTLQVDSFCPQYRVLTLDLPGYGKSGTARKSWTIQQYAADLNFIIRSLDLKNVVLIGHSMAGDIVLEAAMENPDPVIALVGVDNFKDVGAPYDAQDEAEMRSFLNMLKNDFSTIAPIYAEADLFHSSTDSLVRNAVLNDFRKADPGIALAGLESYFEYTLGEAAKLGKLQKPLILINSATSVTRTAGLESAGIPFLILEIPRVGHFPMLEKPREFNDHLRFGLREISKK